MRGMINSSDLTGITLRTRSLLLMYSRYESMSIESLDWNSLIFSISTSATSLQVVEPTTLVDLCDPSDKNTLSALIPENESFL